MRGTGICMLLQMQGNHKTVQTLVWQFATTLAFPNEYPEEAQSILIIHGHSNNFIFIIKLNVFHHIGYVF